MLAKATPVYTSLSKMRVSKHPRHWASEVYDNSGAIVWFDSGWRTKKQALQMAHLWISKKQTTKEN